MGFIVNPYFYTPGVTGTLLLDLYPGAAAAYSLRKLNTSYSGSAIRVRRSSDNAEQNIGFNVGNTLDTTALLAFCGAGNGFVTTWYDQSGNAKNIGNTTAVRQPQIVSAGAVLLENTKPTMRFDGSNDDLVAAFGTILNQPSTMFSVVRPLSLSLGTTRHLIDKDSPGDRQAVYMLLSNNIALFSGSSFDSGVPFTTTQQLITTTFNSTNSTINRNSGATITGNAGTQNQNGLRIGSNAGVASFFNMNLQEVVLYNFNQSSSIPNIRLNLTNFYSIITDSDAQAFITAAGITNGTQQNAINNLVVDLKAYGIWTKMKAIYPFVGGTASTHKFNLKDPRDLDAAFRLVFSGGWTHSSTGALPNGTNGYADSKLNAGTALVSSSAHLSYYSRTNTNPGAITIFDIGVANFSLNKRFIMAIRSTGDLFNTQVGAVPSVLNSSNTDARGLFIGTRTSTTAIAQYKNGVLQTSNTVSETTTLDSANVWLGGINNVGNPTGAFWSNRECAFASIGDGLTSTEAANLYTAIQAYQTTLSRNV